MKKIAICMADGVEEIEALTVVDLCRRAGMEIDMISTQNRGRAMGGHGIQFETDLNIKDTDFKEYDGIILPGGGKGTENLMNNMTVLNTVQNFFEAGKLCAAICAAPTVLGKAGILRGKKAICYPGLESQLLGAEVTVESVVRDGNVITSRGLGTAIDFALAIIAYYLGDEKAEEIATQVVYQA
ncbi:MAG TPA: DJ-1 family protein [Lachnospiraceae bacterium]|jgi:4-methyl-5(b-hydroxyethyl)-thiazole monophosphate biosynthesis|nr:DJ-1 family glyoxalase III [Lachnospiraceae bacterium]HAN50927.1 DJ-1 family protein [Lachnospiraceae bacterium]HBE07739.1 DJ-1 family protein [Lachnospiraceae bacterium]